MESHAPITRIERKRAHDREAQRASRAKTKAYIAHLEKTVAELSQNSGDNRANYLARHVSKQAQELESTQAVLQKVRVLVHDVSKPDQSRSSVEADDDDPDSSPGDAPNKSAKKSIEAEAPCSSGQRSHGGSESTHFSKDIVGESSFLGRPRPVATCATRKIADFGVSLECDESDPHYFQRLDNALSFVERTAEHLSESEEDQDILIRAVVDGWDSAANLHHLDVAWRLFREADETLWHRIRPIDRLAHFWQMRCTMLNKIQPKNQQRRDTPSFMSPTYIQKSNPTHPVVADYFAWPHIRDNLISAGIEQVSGLQTIAFADSFRFIWQYELRDMFKRNTTTGFYSFSEGFMRNFHNLACYKILQSGDETDIPTRMIPQIDWKRGDRVIEYKTPEEQPKDGSPELITGNEPLLIPQTAVVPTVPSPDWMPSLSFDILGDPRYASFAIDPLSMVNGQTLSQWPEM